jgi:hypothetical protein
MYNYVGPTWAQRSFDPPGIQQTNFAKVWQIPYVGHVFPSQPPSTIADKLKSLPGPTVWIYSDPWGDIPRLTGCSLSEFVSRQDWFDIWQEANQKILHKINAFDVPVFLIGTHCDVVDCNFSNITVAHPSWQKYMSEQLGLVHDNSIVIEGRTIKHCVAQEIYFRFFYENPDIKVDLGLKDLITDQWMLWEQFRCQGLMFYYHPTRRSYQNFANYLKPQLLSWLN